TRKIFTRFNSPNAYTLYDLGAANTLLSIQAVDLGLQVRQMAGYDHQKAREIFNVPDDYELGVMMAVGYPAPLETLPEAIRAKELAVRERLLQEHFVKNGIF
ncbi:MAG: nitroreductase, partial [Cytophagia bacterium]|nr:nitroreductase [Cytophagia bacterium]